MRTELDALQNAANNIGLTIHECFNQDKRKTIKHYFATLDNLSVSPKLSYSELNMFLLGWIKSTQLQKTI